MLNRASGIYLITVTKPDGQKRYYVGQSACVRERVKQHMSALRHGRHINPHLQSLWNQVGTDGFEASALEYCDSSELNSREDWWLSEMVGFKRCVNIGTCANAPLRGVQFSEEHKNKIRAAISGEKHYLFGKSHPDSVKEKISASGKGLKRSKETRAKISAAFRGHSNPMFGRHGSKNGRSRAVTAVHLVTGETLEYESATLAEADGFDQGCISKVCNGHKTHHKGYVWSFKTSPL